MNKTIDYKLKSIVPWGRNLREYQTMFNLSQKDLNKKILGCGDGPSSFNAELTKQGGNIISIDPIYEFKKEQLSSRIDEVAVGVMAMVRKYESTFVWKNIANPNELEQIRMSAMRGFLDDYEKGLKEERYVHEQLPKLSFTEKEFDLALSSHFLFLYSEHLDFEFHLDAIEEMLRVSKEVRIFPLMTLENEYSPHLFLIIEKLEEQGYVAQIVKTEYEFQQGAKEMLQIHSKESSATVKKLSALIFVNAKGVERKPTEEEINKMLALCQKRNRPSYYKLRHASGLDESLGLNE